MSNDKKWLYKEQSPREKLIERGPRYLSDAELLAIFLRVGYAGKNVLVLANELIEKKGLKWLLTSNIKDFCEEKGLGPSCYVQLQAVMELGQRYLKDVMRRESDPINSTDKMREYLVYCLGDKPREIFACIFLDNRHRVLKYAEIFSGTIDSASVHPREVIKMALAMNAAAIAIAHNHPSGMVEPSEADKCITQKIKSACELVDIRLLDHFILSGNKSLSFAEEGLL